MLLPGRSSRCFCAFVQTRLCTTCSGEAGYKHAMHQYTPLTMSDQKLGRLVIAEVCSLAIATLLTEGIELQPGCMHSFVYWKLLNWTL